MDRKIILAAFCICGMFPFSAHSETDKVEKIDSVKIIAAKANPTRGITAPVQIYDRKGWTGAPLQTVENLLRINPSIDIRERGAKGVQADIALFGGTADQTMIMLNGVNFTDARTGHQSHSLPVDLAAVSNINIIGGVSGIGAFTGALNIITSPLKDNYARSEISAGENGYLYANISGNASRGSLSVMTIGSVCKSNGYTENTDFKNHNLFTRLNFDSKKAGFFDFQAGYQQKYFGANSFYSVNYPDQAEQTETFLASGRWLKNLDCGLSLSSTVSYRKNYDRFELFRDKAGAPSWYAGHNYHNTDNVGIVLESNYLWKWGNTAIGTDYTMNHIYSNVLGEKLDTPEKAKGYKDIYYTKSKTRNVVNGWIKHSVKIGKWNLAATFNLAHSPYGNFTMWSIAPEYAVNDFWIINAAATQSMRLPTFTDLFYTSKTHNGNITLGPEKAHTYNLGTSYIRGHFVGRANVRYRIGKDIIDWVKKTPEAKWESKQITELNTFCGDIYGAYISDGFLKEASVGYGYTSTNKKSEDYISKYALDYLKNKISLRLKLQVCKSLSVDMTGTWYDRNGKYESKGGKLVSYNPYWLFDSRISWSKGVVVLYADVFNIFNKEYFDFGGIFQPRRWISGGIAITL